MAESDGQNMIQQGCGVCHSDIDAFLDEVRQSREGDTGRPVRLES